MPDEAYEKVLIANLARTNEWLRFAETKNAALLTFSSAWLVAVCSLLSNDKTPAAIRISLLCAVPFIFVGAGFAVFSLLPKYQKKNSVSTAQQATTRNLLFHGNIAKLDLGTATTSFSARYAATSSSSASANHIADLCTQLVETSRITQYKFNLFSRGVASILTGFIAGAAALLVKILVS